MKKLLSIAVLLISLAASAQGNLQFNQVINTQLTGSGAYEVNMGSITVPVGKVWKIESCSYSYNNYTLITTPNRAIDGSSGTTVQIGNHIAYGGGDLYSTAKLPLWLSSGTYNVRSSISSNTSTPRRVNISAIEFNVVP